MLLRKSQFYSSLLRSCDEQRGGMDSHYFIITLQSMQYISDKFADNDGEIIEVPEARSFDDIVKLKGDKKLDSKIIAKLGGRRSEKRFK